MVGDKDWLLFLRLELVQDRCAVRLYKKLIDLYREGILKVYKQAGL